MKNTEDSLLAHVQHFLGMEPENVSAAEKLASTAGGFVSIVFVAMVSYQFSGAAK